MTSRYATGHNLDISSNSPSSSPQGRRYVLKNFNIRKQREIKREKARQRNKDYYDIRAVPSSQGSMGNHSNKPVGTSNKVLPTDNPKSQSPSKTPREPLKYISPRKDQSPRKDPDVKKDKDAQSSRKKAKEKQAAKIDSANNNHPNGTGLTPRDEYMVTKLYDKEIIYLKPSEVRYTHDQITAHFTDGRSLLSTFVALLYGKIEIKLGGVDVPPVEVMQTSEYENGKEGKLWYVVNGNRRLYVFRRLEKCGALTTMQVIARKYDSIEMDKHFLTRNKGRSVSITNDSTINAKFSKEVKRWKDWKAKQPKQKTAKGKGKNSQKTTPGAKSE